MIKKTWKKALAGLCAAVMMFSSVGPVAIETQAAAEISYNDFIESSTGVKMNLQAYFAKDDMRMFAGATGGIQGVTEDRIEPTATKVFDGDESTAVIFRSVNNKWAGDIANGDYIKIGFENATEVKTVKMVFDAAQASDFFNGAVLEYLPSGSETWETIKEYPVGENVKLVDVVLENAVSATAIRLTNLGEKMSGENGRWIRLKEVYVQTADVYARTLRAFDSTILANNASASSTQGESTGKDGKAAWAFDDADHWWHSKYDNSGSGTGGNPSTSNPIYIQTGFGQKWNVEYITYAPRLDVTACNIKDYSVWIANLDNPTDTPSEEDFKMVAVGTLEDAAKVHKIDLGGVREATHIRLRTTSVHNHNNNHVTAKFIKVYGYDVNTSAKQSMLGLGETYTEEFEGVKEFGESSDDTIVSVSNYIDSARLYDRLNGSECTPGIAGNFNETENANIKLSDAEVVFTTGDGDGNWKVYNPKTNKYVVKTGSAYVELSNDANAKENQLNVIKTTTEVGSTFRISRASDIGRYTIFYYKKMLFDTNGTYSASWADGTYELVLLEKQKNVSENDVIPGYTRASEIVSGKTYLITYLWNDGDAKQVIVLYPNATSTTGQTKYVVSKETEELKTLTTVTAVAPGRTTAVIGGVTYDISVVDKNANNAEKDIPVELLSNSTGSQHGDDGKEGPLRYAFDGNENTLWHSDYSGNAWWKTTGNVHVDHLWVAMKFVTPTEVDAVRYLPRNNNGDITSYVVMGTVDNGATWTKLTEGIWTRSGWQIATFAPQVVTGIKLIAIQTAGDTQNRFAAAKELRVRATSAITASLNVTAPTKTTYELNEAFNAEGLVVTRDYNNGEYYSVTLTDADYTVTGFDAATKGDKTITVTDNKYNTTATFTVNVTCSHPEDQVETTPGEDSTCTETGLTEKKECGVCGDVLAEQTEIPVKDHVWSDWTTVEEPTCTKVGSEERTCSVGGETETQEIPVKEHEWSDWTTVEEPTYDKAGLKERTCSVGGEKETEEIPALVREAEFKEASASLTGTIGLNFYVQVNEPKELENLSVRLTRQKENATKPEVKVVELGTVAAEATGTRAGWYKVTFNVAAKEMTDAITADILNDGVVIATATESVKTYATKAKEYYKDNTNLVALLDAMLNYGAAAQLEFEYREETLASTVNLTEKFANTTVAVENAPTITKDEEFDTTKVDLSQVSLLLKEDTVLRLYLKTGKDVDLTTYKVTPALVEGKKYAEVPSISAQNLEERQTFTIADKDGKMITVEYSPLDYAKAVAASSDDADLVNVAKALYEYYVCAETYFTNK